MHELLVVALILPISYIPKYFGQCVGKGTHEFDVFSSYLQRGIALWSHNESEQLLFWRQEMKTLDGSTV